MLWHPLLLLAVVLVAGQEDSCGSGSCEQERRRPCVRADKKKFNENLLTLFRAEYGKELSTDTDNNKILKWKFESLDRNDDGFLQRPEYRPLKRLKRLVKPKKCAKTFARSCDLDKDSQISKEEWSSCLGGNLITFRSSSVVALSEHKKRKDEPEANDCLSDRQTVLAEQRADELYVPECSPDGRYKQVQCYKSTGYCWCVHEDDGKPIPGTSVKDQMPDCNAGPAPSRPMKGCPNEKKEQFLHDLAAFLARNGTDTSLASKTFSNFDENSNNFLDRKEWKRFRTFVAAKKELRRCGKRLPRFCDVNNDRRISSTEWANCIDGLAILSATTITNDTKRKGPNPLKSILKDD